MILGRIKKLYPEHIKSFYVQGDVSWAGQVRLAVSKRVGEGGTGPNPRRFHSRQVFPLIVEKICLVIFVAGQSVLITPLLLSPIYDFQWMSGFEPRLLP